MITGLPTIGGSLTGLIFLMARRTAFAALAEQEAGGFTNGDCFGMDGQRFVTAKATSRQEARFSRPIIWR